MNKESNKSKFEFKLDKYITSDLIKNSIIGVYDITEEDINKNIQILNCNEYNKDEIRKICNIVLDNKKIDFTFEYVFNKAGKYTFKFEFQNLLKNACKLFNGCKSLISLNFGKFKSNYLINMNNMFEGCCKLKALDLSNFKTSDVIYMSGTFKGCTCLKKLDLSSFDTKNVINMDEMFCECESLEVLKLSNFRTNKVTSMKKIFYKCKCLKTVNASSFESDNIKNISEMFSECSSIEYLTLHNFEINNNINTNNMFYNCSYFKFQKDEFLSQIDEYFMEIKCKNYFYDDQIKNPSDFRELAKFKNIKLLTQSIEEFLRKNDFINDLREGKKYINDFINICKNNLNNIMKIVRDKIETIEPQINLDYLEDCIDSIQKYVEKIFSEKYDIKFNITDLSFYFCRPIDDNSIKNLINKFSKKILN